MNEHDNGGPAFPQCAVYDGNRDEVNPVGAYFDAGGMTLRDYFAAKAMQSILSKLDQGIRPQDCIRAAEDAYFMADNMLAARSAK